MVQIQVRTQLMRKILPEIREHTNALLKLLPLLAFAIPCFWLYILYPATFELLWKGRTFQLFFIWLILVELILGWESLQTKMSKPLSARSIAFGVSLFLPATYVLVSNYFGLNTFIADWAQQSGFQWANLMPLSTEYLVFAVLFCLTVYFLHGNSGLKDFSVPVFFMVIVGALYTIDNVFPYGQFTPLQFFVPTTTWLAARTLGLLGYNVTPGIQRDSNGSLPLLTVADPSNPAARSATFAIAWPCAGIESFLIFTVVVLLFLKRMPISWKAKTGYLCNRRRSYLFHKCVENSYHFHNRG